MKAEVKNSQERAQAVKDGQQNVPVKGCDQVSAIALGFAKDYGAAAGGDDVRLETRDIEGLQCSIQAIRGRRKRDRYILP